MFILYVYSESIIFWLERKIKNNSRNGFYS